MTTHDDFIDAIRQSILAGDFQKTTLSRPIVRSEDLMNIYIRLVEIKGKKMLSFTYRHKTNDQVKNYTLELALPLIKKHLSADFRDATLLTMAGDYLLKTNKKKKVSILQTKASLQSKSKNEHDRTKVKRIESERDYLKYLGIADENHKIIPKMADKFRQINKYLEIIENLFAKVDLPNTLKIVDMGSGKGYLSFALYDFLQSKMGKDVSIVGIELREDLVDKCNDIASKCGFEKLLFVKDSIANYESEIDVLIALHACDTATDDAIAKGIHAKAQIIICAPCCHKQIRLEAKGGENPVLKYGIFKERQFEMVTDTMRALILENKGYDANIFEFVSNEHTRKNIMLAATVNANKKLDSREAEIGKIKEEYGIGQHYLEALV